MAKTKMLSMRVSDELLSELNACEGESMAAKFENLVHNAIQRLPLVTHLCEVQNERLEDLKRQCEERRRHLADLNQLMMYRDKMYSSYQEFLKTMQDFAERADRM